MHMYPRIFSTHTKNSLVAIVELKLLSQQTKFPGERFKIKVSTPHKLERILRILEKERLKNAKSL